LGDKIKEIKWPQINDLTTPPAARGSEEHGTGKVIYPQAKEANRAISSRYD
jgi:hypothetical protein